MIRWLPVTYRPKCLMVSLTQTWAMTSSTANHQWTHNWSQECWPLIYFTCPTSSAALAVLRTPCGSGRTRGVIQPSHFTAITMLHISVTQPWRLCEIQDATHTRVQVTFQGALRTIHNMQVDRSGLWVGAVNNPLTNSLGWGWVRRLAMSPILMLGLLVQLLTLMPTLVLWMSTLARRSLPILFWPKNFFRNLVLYLRLSPHTPHCQALRFSRSGESSQVQRSIRPALHALAKEWVRAAEDTA